MSEISRKPPNLFNKELISSLLLSTTMDQIPHKFVNPRLSILKPSLSPRDGIFEEWRIS
jgi:hypothetical protein